MKLAAHANKIGAALALVASAARPNVKKPVLGTVRINAGVGVVTLAGTDLDIAITASACAETIEPGVAAIPHDRLAALISGFAASAALLISTTEINATVTAGRSTYRLPLLPQDTLPDMPAIEAATGEIEIATAGFLHLLEAVAAADTDQSRRYLCGVFLQSVGRNLVSVASDGKRLMRIMIEAETFSEDRTLVIPTSAVTILRGLLTRAKPKTITLRRSQRLLAVIAPDFQFTTKLIECGDDGFPDVKRVIPDPAPKAIQCPREPLLAVLRRLGAVALTDQTATLATLAAAGGTLSINLTRKPDDGSDDLAADGDLDKIVVSVRQLASLLDEFDDASIGLEAVTDIAPLVIRAENKFALITRSHWKDT